ncbi:hypothetical protein [Tistrella mobilis]|uniref:Uncharacterized protein n=1 Tax=Tistrella mobilis (strain KA081020-065) TaxID=1110502 RepID=I3TXP7_TISMK|nr:hypothetical protein [Tistrella mobilis]AFK57535.1 hypothetical protein TMO_c0925 [Tistrella mobilis KA081020-065]
MSNSDKGEKRPIGADGVSIVIGALLTVAGVVGLFMAGHAMDVGIRIFGLGLGVLAIVYIVGEINRHYAAVETDGEGHLPADGPDL